MEKILFHTVQFKNFHVQAKEVMYHVFGDGCGSCHKSDTPVKSKGFPHFFVDDFLADTKRKTKKKTLPKSSFFGKIDTFVLVYRGKPTSFKTRQFAD